MLLPLLSRGVAAIIVLDTMLGCSLPLGERDRTVVGRKEGSSPPPSDNAGVSAISSTEDEVVGDTETKYAVVGDTEVGDAVATGDILLGDAVAGDSVVGGAVATGGILLGDIVIGDTVDGDGATGDILIGDVVIGNGVTGDMLVVGDVVIGDVVIGDTVLGAADGVGSALLLPRHPTEVSVASKHSHCGCGMPFEFTAS